MNEKGICKEHGEFNLVEGCPQCLAGKQGAERLKTAEAINLEAGVGKAEPEQPAPEAVEAEPLFPSILPSDQTAIVRVNPEQDIGVRAYSFQALRLQEYAEQRVIATVDDLKPATDDLSVIAKVKKAFEEKRKEYVKPLQEHVQEINDAFKKLMEPILAADKITRDKILTFQQEQARIRQEQEEINRQKAELAAREAALNGREVEPVELVEVSPEAPKRVSTEMGTTGMTDHWKYEVIDFALLPDEYKVVDSSLLTAVARKHHDQKPVPGVRFYNEPYIAVRAR